VTTEGGSEGSVTIALDAMGGDRAPDQNIQGALEYQRAGGRARVLLVGRRAELEPRAASAGLRVEVIDAPDVVAMGEHPSAALRRRPGTSIAVATELVKSGRAQAVVSAGNTGAAMASAVLILGRIAKIDRPALSQAIPTASGRLLCLLDIGATVDTDARNLLQFAIMGVLFMERVHGIANPSVGLLNLGEEAGKGSRVLQEAEALLRTSGLNFYGNVEGIDIPRGTVNVVVCDGLLGNTVVKAMEGTLDYIRTVLRRDVFGGPLGAIAGMLALPGIRRFRRSFDYELFGGAPLLGVNGVAIVTHGRARPRMVRYAIEVAERAAASRLVDAIRVGLEERAARSAEPA
jgi:glycerol-3-phosphate acyltransferase PlsX